MYGNLQDRTITHWIPIVNDFFYIQKELVIHIHPSETTTLNTHMFCSRTYLVLFETKVCFRCRQLRSSRIRTQCTYLLCYVLTSWDVEGLGSGCLSCTGSPAAFPSASFASPPFFPPVRKSKLLSKFVKKLALEPLCFNFSVYHVQVGLFTFWEWLTVADVSTVGDCDRNRIFVESQ